jgi:predicted secreted protein
MKVFFRSLCACVLILCLVLSPGRALAIGGAWDAIIRVWGLIANEEVGVVLSGDCVNTVKTGQLLSITLSENQTTPYRWEYIISDSALIESDGDIYRSDPNPLGMTGVGGEHTFYFRALQPGICSIELSLLRIGTDEGEAAQHAVYEIIITEDEMEGENHE